MTFDRISRPKREVADQETQEAKQERINDLVAGIIEVGDIHPDDLHQRIDRRETEGITLEEFSAAVAELGFAEEDVKNLSETFGIMKRDLLLDQLVRENKLSMDEFREFSPEAIADSVLNRGYPEQATNNLLNRIFDNYTVDFGDRD